MGWDGLEANIKIINFGTSMSFDDASSLVKDTVGSSYYVAPEVLKKYYD